MKRVFTVLAIVLLVVSVIAASIILFITLSLKSGNSSMQPDGAKPLMPSIVNEVDVEENENSKKAEPTDNSVYLGNLTPDTDIILPDADVYYKGGAYNFNDGIATLLALGVDKDSNESGEHQADVLFLLAINDNEKIIDIIAISRNTMTEVVTENADGTLHSHGEMQICRSYCYGINDEQSSFITMNAVSNLFFGLPINTYFTLFTDALPLIIDDIGAITVTVDEDLTHTDARFKQGATLILNGTDATRYLMARNNTNTTRVKRQIDFVKKFAEKAKTELAKNPALALSIYSDIAKKSTTNITAANIMYLADAALNYKINPLINLTGESGEFNETEALFVDNTMLYELILDIFYTKIN